MVKYDTLNKENKVIDITTNKINKVLGIEIEESKVISILERLGFGVSKEEKTIKVEVPTRRGDISICEDLIEEVGRIYGMDNIKGKLPVLNVISGKYDKTKREIKHFMAGLGLNETMSYSLLSNNSVHFFTKEEFTPVTLNDPMSEDRNTLRYSLLPSLKEIYLYNKARNNSNISIFEMGKGFYKEEDTYKEDLKLAVLITGDFYLDIKKTKADFYILKGIAEELLDYLGYANRYSFIKDENIPNELHPGVSASININGRNVGVLGKVHPKVLKEDVYVMEINLDKLLSMKTGKMKYKEISKYPSIVKDIAFVVDKDISCKSVSDTIKKCSSKILSHVELFDLYEGEHIEEGKKSLAYKLTFMDANKTLTEEEVMNEFNKIINQVNTIYKSTIRDK